MVPMYLGKADVNTYEKGAGREFLVSNGRGSYGFSTVIGANTRREHGLLVVRPEGERQHSVLISKIEETLFENNKKYQLSTNRYKDLVYPDGYRYLQEYQGNPYPSMLFVIHSVLLEKSIFMPAGKACTILKYEILAAPDKVRLDLRPLFAHRINNEVHVDEGKNSFESESFGDLGICVNGRGHTSYCSVTSGTWTIKPLWFENLIYEQDDRADSPSVDHLWSPGFVTQELSQGDVVYVVLSDSPQTFSMNELTEMEKETAGRFEDILERANLPAFSSAEQDLIFASYHLIDDRKSPVSPIYTGYPSVECKARDTFVSLPGLTLATGREDVAENTLKFWLDVCKKNNWVMPERLAADGSYIFEGADNGLWFVYAAHRYMRHIGDAAVVNHRDIWDGVKEIINRYCEGIADLDLSCEENMLLNVKTDNPLRHWMDAVAGDEVVVPRKGFFVEVNALWYSALRIAEKYSEIFEDAAAAKKYASMADVCAKSFCNVFWNDDAKGLYDYVDPECPKCENAIRPNQILAVSLPFSPLPDDKAVKVIRLCWNELYTTYGLRSLDPRHEKFKGRAEGRPDQRIKARFRGMAWPWLLGEFISAYIKHNPQRKDLGWVFMRPFNSHIRHGCLGGVAEIFDGIMPYRPHGDVLSAMALGELLRVLHEDLQYDE